MRLPQSAGDLVRAHPLLEVSGARAGGFEVGPGGPSRRTEPSLPAAAAARSPEVGAELGPAERVGACGIRGTVSSSGP